jgi:glycosyltransferase involved in cell wall biosynthesis
MKNFSVSMAVYINDDASNFKTALESVYNQTVKPSEVVLVVDGPVKKEHDNIINEINASHGNLNVIRLEKNVGHGNARRIGLENCREELVALMDSDDISLPNRFEKQLLCFEKSQSLDVVGGNIAEFLNNTDNVIGMRKVPESDSNIKQFLKSRCPFNQMTVMFKKKSVINAGSYIDWYCDEDYYLWLRMFLLNAEFYNIQDTLVMVRAGKDMYKRRGGIKYFKSEAKLQKFMLHNDIIGLARYIYNVMIRFAVQVLIPNNIRGILFKRFARTKE